MEVVDWDVVVVPLEVHVVEVGPLTVPLPRTVVV
jgi:hypothetical protein